MKFREHLVYKWGVVCVCCVCVLHLQICKYKICIKCSSNEYIEKKIKLKKWAIFIWIKLRDCIAAQASSTLNTTNNHPHHNGKVEWERNCVLIGQSCENIHHLTWNMQRQFGFAIECVGCFVCWTIKRQQHNDKQTPKQAKERIGERTNQTAKQPDNSKNKNHKRNWTEYEMCHECVWLVVIVSHSLWFANTRRLPLFRTILKKPFRSIWLRGCGDKRCILLRAWLGLNKAKKPCFHTHSSTHTHTPNAIYIPFAYLQKLFSRLAKSNLNPHLMPNFTITHLTHFVSRCFIVFYYWAGGVPVGCVCGVTICCMQAFEHNHTLSHMPRG